METDGRTWFSAPSAAGLAGAQACIASVRALKARTAQARPPAAQAAPPVPPAAGESAAWGYTTVSETMASFNVLAYAHSKIDCEASRARDLYDLERDSPWLKARSRSVDRLSLREVFIGHSA